MNIKELRMMLEVAESLGHHDIQIHLDDSRDGAKNYSLAACKFIKTDKDTFVLAFRHSNARK